MRVIAGEKRGIRLLPPGRNDRTRPTEDRMKESIFNIIQPVKSEACVLDLFAGTGQIGIEFLSRGAGTAVFCERSRSMTKILRSNLEKTGYVDRSSIFMGDYREALGKINQSFDYVYLDPPFGFGMEWEAMEMLHRLSRVRPNGMILLETGINRQVAQTIPEEFAGFRRVFDRSYRTKRISIYKDGKEET